MSATAAVSPSKVRRRPPSTEPRALRVLEIGGTVVVVAILIWEIANHWAESVLDVRELLPWLVVVAIADLLPVPIWGSVELMMSFPVLLAAALVFPPYLAGALSFAGTLDAREFRREISPLRGLFNRANVAASVMAASWVFGSFGVSLRQWPQVLLVVFVALLADMVVNFTLVIVGSHLLTSVPPLTLFRNVYGGSRPQVFLGGYACFGLLAVLLATVYSVAGNAGLVAFAIPLLLSRQMFLHWKNLGRATEALASKERALTFTANRIADERRDERLTLAAGIHDEVLPPLYKVHLMGQVVRNDLASGRLLDLEADVPDLLHAVQSADAALRDMIRDLRKSTIGPDGLPETLRLLVREIETETNARIEVEVGPVGGSALTHLLVYQLAREALTNAVRHSGATRIHLLLHQEEGTIRLRISDNGRGFYVSGVDNSSHFGLELMRDRAELAGGLVSVDSTPGIGTSIVASLPIEGKHDDQTR